MRCYICDKETDRWPDNICDNCLAVVNQDLHGNEVEDESFIEDLNEPIEEAFDFDTDDI